LDPSSESLFLTPESEDALELIPAGFHYFAVDDLVVQDIEDAGQLITITGHVTSEESLLDIYTHAGFSTGSDEQIDHPVGATRIAQLDGVLFDDDVKDSFTLPIRFNGVDFFAGEVEVSGQVHGHALKPWMSLRIRPGQNRLQVGVDTDVSLSAELRAKGAIEDEADVELYDLCFPLPDLTFGPVTVPMSLKLEQYLLAAGRFQAGTVVGIQHRVRFGYTVTCEGDEAAVQCSTERTRTSESPLQSSPPELRSGAAGFAEVGTRFEASLEIGSEYPICAGGFNVGLGGELRGRLDVDVDADPWWSMGHGGRVDGHIGLELFGLAFIDHGVDIAEYMRTAERVAPAPPPDSDANVRYLSGEDHRWMVALDQFDTSNLFLDAVDAVVMADGSVTFAISENGDYRLGQLDRYGELVWNHTYRPTGRRSPEALTVLPDGAVMVAGRPSFVAVHEADGQIRWARDYDFSDGVDTGRGITVHDVTVLDADGSGDHVLVGVIARETIRQADGFIARIDDRGDVVWAKIYDGPKRQTLQSITVAADGDLLVVGQTDPDIYGAEGLLLRIDAGDGSLEWSRSLVTAARGSGLLDVVEGKDGAIYAVGSASRDIRRTGAALVLRVDADGTDALMALLIHDLAAEAELDFETVPTVQASDTAHDAFTGIAAVGDGIVVAGKSGLAERRTAWLARLGPKLGVEWFRVLDGDAADAFTSVDVADDGLIVAGLSASLLAEPTDEHAIVAKIPFEGGLALHSEFDHVTTRFMAAGVRNASSDPAVVPDGEPLIDAPLTVVDAVLDGVESVEEVLIDDVTKPECVTLLTATGHPTTSDPCEDLDFLAPIVRLGITEDLVFWDWIVSVTESFPLEVEYFDEVGVVRAELTVDGASAEPGTLLSMEALGLGEHRIEAWAEDAAGHRTTVVETFTVVDDVGPEIEIRSPVSRTYEPDAQVPVDVVATDAHSEIATMRIELNDRVWDDSDVIHMRDLGEGTHRLSVTVEDGASNTTRVWVEFEVGDRTQPAVDAPSGGASGCRCVVDGPGGRGGSPTVGLLLGVLVIGICVRRRRPARTERAADPAPSRSHDTSEQPSNGAAKRGCSTGGRLGLEEPELGCLRGRR